MRFDTEIWLEENQCETKTMIRTGEKMLLVYSVVYIESLKFTGEYN